MNTLMTENVEESFCTAILIILQLISVQILLKEIYKNYESCSHSTGGCKQNKMKTICINNTDTQLRQQQKDLLYGE